MLGIMVGAVFAAYFGYLLGGAWYKGIEISEFMSRLNEVLSKPFRWYFNDNTL